MVKSGRRTTSPRISIVSSRPRLSTLEAYRKVSLIKEIISVRDPDPDPLVKGYGSYPFLIKMLSTTEIMLAKKIFCKKLNF